MRLLLVKFLLLSSMSIYAHTFEVELEFQVSGEFMEIETEELISQGWIVSVDEFEENTYRKKIIFEQADLPIKENIGDSFFTISKTGEMEMGLVLGDSDVTSYTSLFLPTNEAGILPILHPLTLTGSGGEYAGGLGNYRGKVVISTL